DEGQEEPDEVKPRTLGSPVPPSTSTSGSSQPPPGAVTLSTLFMGARVVRGTHWTYRDQDGGPSKMGTIIGWHQADGYRPPDGDNPVSRGWAKVRWDNRRANSYEAGANNKYAINYADATPGAPRGLSVVRKTDRSITIAWLPPENRGQPELDSYTIYRDGRTTATVGSNTLQFTNSGCLRGWPYKYSVAAHGAAGMGPKCPSVEAITATKDDRQTQLSLWVGGEGKIHFVMG
ncbi:unnamed protein product, partial [Discosporangium mesarthrocarpum]